ncbi:MAG: Na+/H+ antiporter subunit D, partial [Pseudomonadota bacterium]
TIYSMTKIWGSAFWKPHPDGTVPALGDMPGDDRRALIVPIAGLAILTIIIGLFPQQFIEVATRAAEELLDPTAYLTAVLGEVPAE